MGALCSRFLVGLLECFAELFSATQFPVVCAEDRLRFQSHRAAAGVRRALMLVLDSRGVCPESDPTAHRSRSTGRSWHA